jgi:hypothetical protein
MKDVLSLGNEMDKNAGVVDESSGEFQKGHVVFSDGAPHPAFAFALGYLGVRDLLLVETVCRSLRYTVRSDPLLWRSIHIDQPLNEKITEDVLLQLTDRAQGNLQCLSLVKCPRITDDGLKQLLKSNPRLTKVSSCSSNFVLALIPQYLSLLVETLEKRDHFPIVIQLIALYIFSLFDPNKITLCSAFFFFCFKMSICMAEHFWLVYSL